MRLVVETNPDYSNGKPRVAKFRRPMPPTFTDPVEERVYCKGRLAMACRVMAKEGWSFGCSMTLSSRDPSDPSVMFVNPAGKSLGTIRSLDLMILRISDGSVVDEGATNMGYDVNAVDIHRAIYNARPDHSAIISGHTPHLRAFTQHHSELKMIAQDACTYYGEQAELPLEVGLDAGSNPEGVAKCLGTGKVLWMRSRGGLAASVTIEGATALFIRMETLSHAQMIAEGAAKGRGHDLTLVGEIEVQFTKKNVSSPHHAWLGAMPYFQEQDRATGGAMVI